MKTTIKFSEAKKICRPFKKLRFPEAIEKLLESGAVMYVFRDDGRSMPCWPHFPIGNHRTIVKELKTFGVVVPKSVKVIITIDTSHNSDVERYMLDCLGHTLLYLTNPRARNECEDAANIIDTFGIYYE